MKNLLVLSVLCVIIGNISGEVFEECANQETGSFIGGTQGCQSYIYCDGDDSYEGFCPSQLLFSTKDGSCAPASQVDCKANDPTTTTTTTTTTKAPTTPTTPPTTTKAATTTTTTTKLPITTTKPPTSAVFVEIESEEEPEEPPNEVSDPTPTEPQLVLDLQTTSTPSTTTTTISGISSTSRPTQVCPDNDKKDEIIFLPSNVSCSEYFVCYHGTPVPMYCSGQLYFDYLTSKCELPERVNCKIGGPPLQNPKKVCTVNTFDFFPYPKNCNYFYKCINGFLSLQQCPVGFGWSAERKLCIRLHRGKCPS